jgi:hypothetical protein
MILIEAHKFDKQTTTQILKIKITITNANVTTRFQVPF